MAERFTQRGQIGVQNLRSGASEGLMGLSNLMGQFAQQRTQKMLQEAEEEGLAAGQAAGAALEEGEKPEFKEEGFIGGVRAKAFNRGLRQSYAAGVANDMRQDAAAVELEHDADVAGYDNAMAAKRAALAQEVDPVIRADILSRFDKAATSGRIRVQERQAKVIRKQQVDTFNSHIETATNDAMIAARSQDMQTSALAIQEAHQSINEAVAADILTEDAGNKQKRLIERVSTEEGWKGWIEGVAERDGIEAGFKALSDLETKPPAGFTQPEWDGLRSDLQQTLTRQRSIENAQKVDESKEAAAALKDFENASTVGFKVSPQETQRVADAVSGFPELQKRFSIIQDVKSFSVMSASDRNAGLAAIQTGQLEDVDQAAAMIKANAEVNRLARQDGYSLGVKQGLVENIPFGPGTFAAKVDQARMLSNHYGTPVSPLSSAEAKSMSDGLPDMTVPEKIALANEIAIAPEVWGQLSKNNAGPFAMAGASGDDTLMEAVFKGQELLSQKLVKPLAPVDYLSDFNSWVEGVYGPEDAANVMNAALAHYAGTEASLAGDAYSSRNFKKSVMAVTGGIGEVNGYKMELPRGVAEDTFTDFVDDMQPETIAKLGGVQGMTNERAAELVSQGRIRSIKSNQYVVELDGGTLFSGPDKPFIIEWTEDLYATQEAARLLKESKRKEEARGR